MSRITGVVVALATAAAVLTGSGVGASAPPASAAPAATTSAVSGLPREIAGGVELVLPDGDHLRLWAGRGFQGVWSKRYDTATGSWGERRVVLRKEGLACGRVEARTAAGAVAVTALCNRGGYPEDSPPTSSRALWSADTVTWSSFRLEGEAYDEPGISPDGSRAVWPEFRGYVTRGPEGFVRRAFEAPGEEYTTTLTISDEAQVSYVYGGPVSRRRCALIVLTRTGDAAPTRQEVPLDNACSDVDLENVDSNTVVFGELQLPQSVAVVSRADASAPWAVTRIAPEDAPGLYQTWRALDQYFFTAPGLPLFALGSTDRRSVQAQAYDPATQTWAAPRTIFTSPRRCSWGDNWSDGPLGVVAAGLACGDRSQVVLTTQDGSTWRALRGDWSGRGQSPDGQYVAVPARTGTYVLSPERGVTTLPGGVRGPCDMVVPDGPDGAVLLTAAGRHRGWPTVLQHSAADGWSRLGRTSLPTPPGRCRTARAATWSTPSYFEVWGGRGEGYGVRIVRSGGGWTVRPVRW